MRKLWRQQRFFSILALIGLILLGIHLVADQFNGPEADRWIYYTRSGFYALIALASARLVRRVDQRVLPQLFVLIMLLIITDLGFYFARGRPVIEHLKFKLPDLPEGHPGILLGELPNPSAIHHDVKVVPDTTFQADYTIDEHFRRVTPHHDSTAERHALFFGCSVCFGQWMSDEQTLPARFQEQTKGCNAYNYSFPGWGAEQMLARIEEQDLTMQVAEEEGIGVYVFIWPHIYRAIGDMRTYCSWAFQHPYYELIDGEAIRNKRFKDGRPITSALYELAWRSNIVRYFDLNFPLELNEDHLKLHLAIVRKTKQLYLEQFPKGRFVVLWAQDWPFPTDTALQHRYPTLLREAGIDMIDGRRPHLMDNRYALKHDAHPTALAYEDMARMLHAGLDSLNRALESGK